MKGVKTLNGAPPRLKRSTQEACDCDKLADVQTGVKSAAPGGIIHLKVDQMEVNNLCDRKKKPQMVTMIKER